MGSCVLLHQCPPLTPGLVPVADAPKEWMNEQMNDLIQVRLVLFIFIKECADEFPKSQPIH